MNINESPEGNAMKFILNGRTFDTATAVPVAVLRGVSSPVRDYSELHDWYPAESARYEDVLYRTAKGAFFLHEHATLKYAKGKPAVIDEAKEMEPTEAVKWITEAGASILNDQDLPLPPEA